MSHRIYSPDVESIPHGCSGGLPDDPNAEMQQAADVRAEMDEAFGYNVQPTDDEIDAMYAAWLARQSYDAGGQGEDPRPTPPAAALPVPPRETVEAVARQLSDDALIELVANPGLSECTPGAMVEDVYSAEVLRRLDAMNADRQAA